MKSLIILLIAATCGTGCSSNRELQANMVAATLIKVDVVKRFSGKEKMFTWKTDNDVTYITFEPNYVDIPVGTITRVLIQK